MTELEAQRFCDARGIPHDTVLVGKGPRVFRVLDLSQVPHGLRENFDERGILIPEEDPATLELHDVPITEEKTQAERDAAVSESEEGGASQSQEGA